MKRLFFTLLCLVLLFCNQGGLLGALEMEVIAGVNNLTFQPDRTQAHSSSSNSQFQASPFFIGNISIKGSVSEIINLNINYIRDNILQNNLDLRLSAQTEFFNFEVGAFVGLTDNLDKPDAGIIGNIDFTYPGIIFISLGGSSTLGTSYEMSSANFRETVNLKIGFWLPYVIPSFSLTTKSLTRQVDSGSGTFLTINDYLVRIMASADFYSKRHSATLRIDAGYEILKRDYASAGVTDRDRLSAFFAGFEVKWNVNDSLKFLIGGEVPFMVKITEPVTSTNDFSLFSARAGFIYTFR